MNLEKERCEKCLEPITNPICVDCYIQQLIIWLNDLDINSKAKIFVLSLIKRKMPLDTLNETKCILCHRSEVDLCSYCFFLIANKTLNEVCFPEKTIQNLNQIFRYN